MPTGIKKRTALADPSRGVDGIRTRDEGFADPCLTTWPRRRRKLLERAMGFEPTTFSLARRRSTTEPRPQVLHDSAESAESQNRTDDTAIFSRVLYQLSYLGRCIVLEAGELYLTRMGLVKQAACGASISSAWRADALRREHAGQQGRPRRYNPALDEIEA